MVRFLIDVDEVLADCNAKILSFLESHYGRRMSFEELLPENGWDLWTYLPEDVREPLWQEMRKPGFCFGLEPFQEAFEAVAQLSALTDLYVVTAPFMSPTWVFERYKWLRFHFGIKPERVIVTQAKYACKGDFLLDDRPDNVTRWADSHPSGVAMLWNTPQNARIQGLDDFRVDSWERVIEIVENYA